MAFQHHWLCAQPNKLFRAPLNCRSSQAGFSIGEALLLFADVLVLGLDFERAAYEPLLKTKDRLEALQAFQEKRKPNFKGE